jgi:prepilin-type N-terminal cleavage/methylation domain-containing protein
MLFFYQRQKTSGFTLLEMLVVIGVIGILFSIAGHHHVRVLKKSKDASLKLEVNQLRIAIHQFALDNSGRFPENLAQLTPEYLKKIESHWQGAEGSGIYHYDSDAGNIVLYESNGREISRIIDTSGNVYGQY